MNPKVGLTVNNLDRCLPDNATHQIDSRTSGFREDVFPINVYVTIMLISDQWGGADSASGGIIWTILA